MAVLHGGLHQKSWRGKGNRVRRRIFSRSRWLWSRSVLDDASAVHLQLITFALELMKVFTGSAPFNLYHHLSITAKLAIMRGERPSRPAHPDFTDELWALMHRCWNQDPHSRPDVSEVLRCLHCLLALFRSMIKRSPT